MKTLLALGLVLLVWAPAAAQTGDGITDDRDALAALDASESITLPKGTYRIASALTLASVLRLGYGTMLSPDVGVVVTLKRVPDAGPYRIFTGAGKVTFAAGRTNPAWGGRYVPEWWGAVANNATEAGPAIKAMIEAVPSGSEVYFSRGSYSVITGCPIFVTKTLAIVGASSGPSSDHAAVIQGNCNEAVFRFGGGTPHVRLQALYIANASRASNAKTLVASGLEMFKIRDSTIIGRQAISLEGSVHNTVIEDNHIVGLPGCSQGTLPDCFGIAGVGGRVIGNNIIGSGDGLRTGPNIYAMLNRIENNAVGIAVGKLANGAVTNSSGYIGLHSMEDNFTGIHIHAAYLLTIQGLQPQSGGGQLDCGGIGGVTCAYGIRVTGGMTNVEFRNVVAGGFNAVATLSLEGAFAKNVVFENVTITNTNLLGKVCDNRMALQWAGLRCE